MNSTFPQRDYYDENADTSHPAWTRRGGKVEAALAVVAPRRHPRDGVRLQPAHGGDRPHLHERPAHPRAGDRRRRGDPLHAGERRARAGGLPQVRPHGARHALGPRRVPRPGLQRRVPAPAGRDRAGHARPRAPRPARTRSSIRTRPRAWTPASTACSRRTATTPAPARCASRRPRRPPGRRRRRSGPSTSRETSPRRACPRSTSATRTSSRTSTPTSRGRRGRRSRTGPGRTTPTRTTGPTSRPSATGRAPRPTSGARSASSPCSAGSGPSCSLFGQFDYLGWHGTVGERARARQRARPLDPDPEPEGGRPLLRRRRAAVPAPDAGGRRPRPLPRRVGRLLRVRPRAVPPLQPAADLPPPARHLLDRHRVGGRRPLPRADRRRRRAPRAAGGRPRAARGPRRRRLREPRRRVAGHQRPPRDSSGSGSATRARSTWTSAASGSSCWRPASWSGSSSCTGRCARRSATRSGPSWPRSSSTPRPRSRSSTCPRSSTAPAPTSP